jgi:hypothetical protein
MNHPPPRGPGNKMQDHSHRFLFLSATALMCAALVYGSRAGPTLLLPDVPPPQSAIAKPPTVSSAAHGAVRSVSFRTSEAAPQTNGNSPVDEATQPGTASVVPNDASCPAADAAALVSPPSVNAGIGSPTPIERTALPRQGLTGAALGTGSSCPPGRNNDAAHKKPSAAADSLTPHGAGALSRGAARP